MKHGGAFTQKEINLDLVIIFSVLGAHFNTKLEYTEVLKATEWDTLNHRDGTSEQATIVTDGLQTVF